MQMQLHVLENVYFILYPELWCNCNMQTKTCRVHVCDNYSMCIQMFVSMQKEIKPPVSTSDVIIQNKNNMNGCRAGDGHCNDWSFSTTV